MRLLLCISVLCALACDASVAQSRLRGRIETSDGGVGRTWLVEAHASSGLVVRAKSKANGFFQFEVPAGETWVVWAYENDGDGESRVTEPSRILRPGRSIALQESEWRQRRVVVRARRSAPWRRFGPLRFEVIARLDSGAVLRLPLVPSAQRPEEDAVVLRIPRVPGDAVHVQAIPHGSLPLPSVLAPLRLMSNTDEGSASIDYTLMPPHAMELEVEFEGAVKPGASLYVDDALRWNEVPARFVGRTDANGRLRVVMPRLSVAPRAFRLGVPGASMDTARPRRRDADGTRFRLVYRARQTHKATVDPAGLDGLEIVTQGKSRAHRRLRAALPEDGEIALAGLRKEDVVEYWGRVASAVREKAGDEQPLGRWALLSERLTPRGVGTKPEEWSAKLAMSSLARVRVEVLADDGTAVASPRIFVEGESGYRRVMTGSSRGRLTFLVPPRAAWRTWAVWDGGVTDLASTEDVEDGRVTLRGKRRVRVTGRVVDEDGNPVRATIDVHPTMRMTGHLEANQAVIAQRLRSGADGRFEFRVPFPELDWTVRVQSTDGKTRYRATKSGLASDLAEEEQKLELREVQPLRVFGGGGRGGIPNPLPGGRAFRK